MFSKGKVVSLLVLTFETASCSAMRLQMPPQCKLSAVLLAEPSGWINVFLASVNAFRLPEYWMNKNVFPLEIICLCVYSVVFHNEEINNTAKASVTYKCLWTEAKLHNKCKPEVVFIIFKASYPSKKAHKLELALYPCSLNVQTTDQQGATATFNYRGRTEIGISKY